jgi:hypothetical protein
VRCTAVLPFGCGFGHTMPETCWRPPKIPNFGIFRRCLPLKTGNFGPLSGPRGGITATLPKSILGRCIARARVSLEQHHRDRGAESVSRVPEIWIRRQRCVRLDEFYKKGCQEKKFFLDRIRDFFLEIQPTVGSLLWRSLACCPFSRVFSADGDDAIEFERAASELAASEATMVLSEAHGLWLFLVIRDI